MPWTEAQIADHIEMDHERELAPGTKGLRSMHAQMHRGRDDWGHRHYHGNILFPRHNRDEVDFAQPEVDIWTPGQ